VSKNITGRWLVFLALFVLGIVAAVVIPLYLLRGGMMGSSTPDPYSQYVALTSGSPVKIVCEISTSPTNGSVQGIFLVKNNDGSYTRTGRVVHVHYTGSLPVVMGSAQDVHQGTMVQISGHSGGDGSVSAEQIVILTGYVTVH
jgi:hypothetical protein